MVEVIQSFTVSLTVHEASVVKEAETDAAFYAVIKVNNADFKTKCIGTS